MSFIYLNFLKGIGVGEWNEEKWLSERRGEIGESVGVCLCVCLNFYGNKVQEMY